MDWVSLRWVCEGDGLQQGSVSELINTLGDLEGFPSLTYIQEEKLITMAN